MFVLLIFDARIALQTKLPLSLWIRCKFFNFPVQFQFLLVILSSFQNSLWWETIKFTNVSSFMNSQQKTSKLGITYIHKKCNLKACPTTASCYHCNLHLRNWWCNTERNYLYILINRDYKWREISQQFRQKGRLGSWRTKRRGQWERLRNELPQTRINHLSLLVWIL